MREWGKNGKIFIISSNLEISNVKKSCLPLVEGNPKAPFSIATTPRCRRGNYSFLDGFTLPSISTL